MRKIFTIAARDYIAAVCTKGFIIGLVMLPVLIGTSILIQKLLVDDLETKERKFAIVDRSPGHELVGFLQEVVKVRNEKDIFDDDTGVQFDPEYVIENAEPSADKDEAVAQQRFELSERVRKGELFGFLEIRPEVYDDAAPDEKEFIRYQSKNPGRGGSFKRWAERVINEAIQQRRFAEAGLSRAKILQMQRPVAIKTRGLSQKNPETGAIEEASQEERWAQIFVPMGLVGMMMMFIFAGATPLMQGVMEEKNQRIAEVLLGSVQPFQLMMGKLIGMILASLTGGILYMGSGLWAAQYYGLTELINLELLCWFLVLLILGLVMFGSLFMAVGSACSEPKEAQNLMMPITLLICLPSIAVMQVWAEPNSTLATGLSFFPFSAPMFLAARLGTGADIPVWQPYVGVASVLLATLVCVYVAGRIFRVGILMQGKGARYRDLLRWIVQG